MIVLPPFGKTKICVTSFQLWQRYWYSYKKILNDSILNAIPTEINGFCQGSADYAVARGTNAGAAEQNLRRIPGEQSSSLSFLDPPLWTCTIDSLKALLLNCTGEARTFLYCLRTLDSSQCCNQAAFLKSSLSIHNICFRSSLRSNSSPDELVTTFPDQLTAKFMPRSSILSLRFQKKSHLPQLRKSNAICKWL